MSKEYWYRIAANDIVWGIYTIRAKSDEEAFEKLKKGDYTEYEQEDYTDDSIPFDPEIIDKEEIKDD